MRGFSFLSPTNVIFFLAANNPKKVTWWLFRRRFHGRAEWGEAVESPGTAARKLPPAFRYFPASEEWVINLDGFSPLSEGLSDG